MWSALPFEKPSPDALGRPSRKAATVAMEAHLSVLKGEPLRAALSDALAEQKGLGGQERRFAALACRELSRHMRLLDHAAKLLGQAPSASILKEDQVLVRYTLWRRLLTDAEWPRIANEVKLPGPLRPRSIKDPVLEKVGTGALPDSVEGEGLEQLATIYSFPRWLSEKLAAEVPADEVGPLFAGLDREPELILRARPPGSREAVLELLAGEDVRAEALSWAPDAIRILDAGGRVFETKAMKSGRLQVQDLGSQLIVEACRPSASGTLSGAYVADVCAGAGGKTLALADRVGPKGKVLAGDASWRRLGEAKSRVGKAGLGNVRFSVPATPKDEQVVLIDAPCSGSGTLAREPDQKWKLNAEKVKEVAAKQRQLLDQVAAAVAPGALVVYATCSVLREENEGQVEAFLGRHPEFALEPAEAVLPAEVCRGGYLRAFPHQVPGGGFFAARLRRTR